jgi:hypothetical protein
MDLLKVFVGDASGVAASVSAMVPGDLLLLDAATYTPLAANTSGLTSKDVIIASCISKNGVNTPVFSTPIKKTNIKYITAVNDNEASFAEGTSTATVSTTALAASSTYSIGVQIKEDLRMGTYNKNTEIIGAYTTPATIPSDGFVKMEMASTIAKGFAANPLTSAGAPSQLVNVTRTFSALPTGNTNTAATFTMKRGSRQVTWVTGTDTLAAGVVAGVVLSLADSWYLVESVDRTNGIITLDTAYQGTATTAIKNATVALTTAYYTATNPTTFNFKFTAIAQTQQNRYDQFRVVDFVVITPKGNDAGLVTIAATAPVYPIGSYRQIRDLEEKSYTNSNPLINYREFPFETFPLNATPGTFYCIVTVSYVSGWGYNMMQSSQPEFLQTAVVAAPFAADGQFDVTPTTTNAGSFLETWSAWAGSPTSGSYTFS